MIKTLLDLLSRFREIGDREAICHYDGFRTRKLSYSQLLSKSGAFAQFLDQTNIKKGNRLLLWGENRPEWVSAFWGAVARGVHVVPVDPSFSIDFVRRVAATTDACLLIHGDSVQADSVTSPRLSYRTIRELPPAPLEPIEINEDDVVEVIFTSGTTGEPKGVVHRHRNLCANLNPVHQEISLYRWMATPFQPIRILNLLPLSHMFGQSMSLFIPSLLGGSSVFVSDSGPRSTIDAIRRQRVSVLVCVPRLLTQLVDSLQHRIDLPEKRIRTSGVPGVAERWWKYREVHRLFGWKFWAVVVGGAHLNPDLETFWTRLGYLVVQGYGLTEASPIVALNHPFEKRRGSIGKPLPGQEVRLGDDGEILVRGASIVTEYLHQGEGHGAPQTVVSGDEWLHTGDIGTIDEDGFLYFRGRKRDVIVTSDGMNVYPEDLERILNSFGEIEASTVIGLKQAGQEVVHAVLIPSRLPGNLADTIRQANQKLEPHQRIKAWTVWPGSDFPRTGSTLKIKRQAVAERVAELRQARSGQLTGEQVTTNRLKLVLAQITVRDAAQIEESDRLAEDLGLSSLDRVDLLCRLEQQYGLILGEQGFTELTTVAQLSEWFERSARLKAPTQVHPWEEQPWRRSPYDPPRWTLRFPIRAVRNSIRNLVTLPLFKRYISLEVTGREQLTNIEPPVIFAANHASNLDTVAFLAALPRAWRPRIAPAIRLEYFEAHFRPDRFSASERIRSTVEYWLACVLFNTYPLPQRSGGVRDFIRYAGELADKGYATLLFPEGERTDDGTLKPFKPGLGLLAKNLDLPVVPTYIRGTFEIMSRHKSWPKSGSVQVYFGPAFHLEAEQTPEDATAVVFREIKRLAGS